MSVELFQSNSQQPQELATPFEFLPPSATEAITRAEIDIQISTAKRYPRSYVVVKKKMQELATLDVETAQSCFYKLNRQGKNIEGPSVRLAEIAASCFGNMRAAAQVVDNDGKTITARGMCHDLETNSCFAVEVKRRITGKDGRTYSDDMQVVTGNAACSIALRNAIFKTVPFALIKPVYEQAKRTAIGDLTTLADRRTKMLSAFQAMGVMPARVLAAVGKPGLEEIGLSELESLIGLHTAIRDGNITVDEAFPEVALAPKGLVNKPAPTNQTQAGTEAEPGATGKGQPAAPHGSSGADAPPVQPSVPPASKFTDDQLPGEFQRLQKNADISDSELEEYAKGKKMLKADQELPELSLARLRQLVEGWETVQAEIAAKKGGAQ